MTRKTTQQDYDSVFESGRSRSRAKSGTRPEPAASPDDVCEFVEQQVSQITNAVRLMAAKLQPFALESEPVPVEPAACVECARHAEPHLHGAKLYAAGKELY